MVSGESDSTRQPHPRPGMGIFILLGLALLSAAGPLGMDMFMPSLPQIAVDYSTTAPMAQLGITFFMLGMGLGQVFIGPLSDERGRRKLLISGMIVAVAASIVCAVAPTIEVFIAGRLLQGTAGGVGVVLARAIVGDRVSGARAAKAYAVMMTVVGVAPVIAPLIGAAVAGVFHWRAVFWLLVIIAVAQLLVALRLPESLPPDQRAGTGVAGTFRNMGGLLTVRPFAANLVVFGLGFGAMFSFISGSSVVLQQQLGLSAGMYSVVFAINASALIVTNIIGGRLAGRVSSQRLQAVGVTLVALGALSLEIVTLTDPVVVPVVASTFVLTSGTALCMVHSTAIAQGMATGRQGAASALLGASQFAVGSLVSPLVAVGDNKLASMAIVMAVCAAGAVVGKLVSFTSRSASAD